MELIEGVPLAEHFNSLKEKQQQFTEDRIWNVFIQVTNLETLERKFPLGRATCVEKDQLHFIWSVQSASGAVLPASAALSSGGV